MSDRCNLCTENDHALRDGLAKQRWESRLCGFDGSPFEEAGSFWQRVCRELAEFAINGLTR